MEGEPLRECAICRRIRSLPRADMGNEGVPLLRPLPSHLNEWIQWFPSFVSLPPSPSLPSEFILITVTKLTILKQSLDHVTLMPQTPWQLLRACQIMFMRLACPSLSALLWASTDYLPWAPLLSGFGCGHWQALVGCWRVTAEGDEVPGYLFLSSLSL